jgi:hypothetical protein
MFINKSQGAVEQQIKIATIRPQTMEVSLKAGISRPATQSHKKPRPA